jgi:hypothetical protein
MHLLHQMIEFYTVAYYAGLLHLDNRAIQTYATGWLANKLED